MNSISIARNSVLKPVDPIWRSIRDEAMEAVDRDPLLAAFLYSTILNQENLEEAVIHRLAERLAHQDVGADLIRQTFKAMLADWPEWSSVLRVDIQAYYDRDPACDRFIMPVLYFKGFHAIQTHRLAHWLWNHGRQDFALYLQSRSSSIFQTDINPAARVGKGIFLDHATGLVVGQTAVIEDNVSILHGVTLGGTGKAGGDRHPKIRYGVLIGAGAKILGNIEIGHCSKIAAGSVVLSAVPSNKTVAGVPARVVGESGCEQPARQMDQLLPSQTMDHVVSFDI
ncbi:MULTISPECIES: serine O-acetyltransferase [unclassified Mesorhizobium]|uniref:serine O-acetyltransferase n=1 Tax=unclassified Mesorhizobium TaxID=325217 RepID=UPI0006FDB1B3|nr:MULTISPECIES: serine O-acetyltransferase [unclassified Mesorhizobium]KQZ13184.1 serine acetyltransferase [Mesorhizobium sp. Root1471]KQZ35699.1 serine acetyltransferase [Mesorhizobium sp. Root554]MDR7031983.1 serine O-acetyltransferase [Mesorhizobium sp. BE184]